MIESNLKNLHTKKFFALIIFAVTIFISGCGEESQTITLPQDYIHSSETVNEKSNVDVYFDATVSMKGYTTLGAGNVYRTLPDILTDIGSSMGEIKFYKFGAEIVALENRDYRKFSSPEPYIEKITAVQNVIDKADANHLSIIVTDLFESDSDWSNISRKIREKYFANHLAVAVIGVKNSFDGEIFDVGLNAAKFQYSSYDYDYRFRPFYILAMGQEVEVNKFIEKFKERQTLPNETNYLLLSENLTSSTKQNSKLPLNDLQNFYLNDKLSLADDSVQELGVDKFSEPASFSVQFDYNPQFGSCPLNMSEIISDIKIFSLTDEEWQPINADKVKVNFQHSEEGENKFTLTFEMLPEEILQEGKLNFIHVDLSPSEKGYLLPDWVKAWNMANVDVSQQNFDGSKTINLIHVIGSLKDSVFAASRPALLNLNFIIDAR